jgi:putative sigma-54 modulation protein
MALELKIHARDMNVTPHLREYVEKKVSKLDRYLPTISEARMDLAEVKSARSAADRHVAQLTVHTRGVVLRAEERHDDIFAAVDAVMDKISGTKASAGAVGEMAPRPTPWMLGMNWRRRRQ